MPQNVLQNDLTVNLLDSPESKKNRMHLTFSSLVPAEHFSGLSVRLGLQGFVPHVGFRRSFQTECRETGKCFATRWWFQFFVICSSLILWKRSIC